MLPLRLSPTFTSIVAVAAVCLCLVASGDASFAATPLESVTIQHSVLVDQQVLDLELEPGSGSPEVGQSQAMTLAASYLAGSAQATSVQSRYVLLTFRDADGKVVGGIQARPAWLVTFRGVSYVPGSSSASVCSCAAVYQRPSTVVTLDARTGALITLLGADN